VRLHNIILHTHNLRAILQEYDNPKLKGLNHEGWVPETRPEKEPVNADSYVD